MNNFQDYFDGVNYIRPSAQATISSATDTNFDFAIEADDLGFAAILDVVSRSNGAAAISAVKFASDSGISADVVTYSDSALTDAILKNDRDSSTAPFAQTALSAAGKTRIAFGGINKKVHKYCRVIVTTTGGTVSLVAQLHVLVKKAKSPITQA